MDSFFRMLSIKKRNFKKMFHIKNKRTASLLEKRGVYAENRFILKRKKLFSVKRSVNQAYMWITNGYLRLVACIDK